jgi:hypothetical protein
LGTHTGFIADQTVYNYYQYLTLAILFTIAIASLADAEEAHERHAHEFHRHHAALIVGNTQNDGSKNGLSVGIDYAYRFNRWLGLGGIAEYAGGDFEHVLLLAGASIHPYKNWVLVVMGGTEVHNEHDEHEEDKRKGEWVVRTGIAYQFPIAENWTIAPEFNVDFSEHETLFVYGIAIGFGF